MDYKIRAEPQTTKGFNDAHRYWAGLQRQHLPNAGDKKPNRFDYGCEVDVNEKARLDASDSMRIFLEILPNDSKGIGQLWRQFPWILFREATNIYTI
ncbi:MAG TPA: hypothetical protein VGL56_00695 [Fimbriimonadaceae bacterium]